MRTHLSTHAFPLVLASLLLHAPVAFAGALVLSPRHEPGDRYALVIETASETEAVTKRAGVEPFRERVEQVYRAEVEVLEVDAEGRAIRERHERVRLTGARGGETGSLFGEDVGYEVERDEHGRIRIHAEAAAESARIERVVVPLLENRLAHSLGAALLEPGGRVEVGASWTLSKPLARRLLRGADVRVVRFDGEPTAVLRPHASNADLVSLHYTIPVARFELRDMPGHTRTTRSRARFEGRVDLAADGAGGLVSHHATLELRMSGTVDPGGVAAPFGWSLARSERSSERTRALEPVGRENAAAAGRQTASVTGRESAPASAAAVDFIAP